jgi:hypothetical protein
VAKRCTNSEEWLAATELEPLFNWFRGIIRQNSRKLRLFAVACCRLIWDELHDKRSRRAVKVAERYADGLATAEELRAAWDAAGQAHEESFAIRDKLGSYLDWAAQMLCKDDAFFAATRVSDMASTPRCGVLRRGPAAWILGRWALAPAKPTGAEYDLQVAVLRDIVGNPFRPVAFDPSWRTAAAVAVARSMYESRTFGEMPYLADALEDAGCDSPDVLGHCRTPGRHVRGCWVVDLVLDKPANEKAT